MSERFTPKARAQIFAHAILNCQANHLMTLLEKIFLEISAAEDMRDNFRGEFWESHTVEAYDKIRADNRKEFEL